MYFSQDYSPHDHRFLTALADTEHEVHYLRLERRQPPLEPRPLPAGVQGVDWWGGSRMVDWWQYPRAWSEVGRVLTKLRPDLIHAGPVQSPAFLTAAAGGAPLVTMSWGSDLLQAARSGLGRWLARWTLKRSGAIACDCQAVRRRAIELGAEEEDIFVFPWGVDLQTFVPGEADRLRRQLGIGEHAFVLLSTRSWEHRYGIPELVEGFIGAARQREELRLIMLGGGRLEAEIRPRLARAGLLDRVLMPGRIANDQLPAYYQASDLYVSASHSDGSSISLLEAMASGLPAVVSDIAGNREWIEPRENGWWFGKGRAGELANAILHALSEREALAEMGRRSRQIAEDRADWSQNFPVLLAAYQHATRAVDRS